MPIRRSRTGIRRTGAMHGKERNHDDGAKPLRDDALRRLQIHLGALDVFGDHWRMLAQGELNRGLAWRNTFRRQAQPASAPSKPHFQRTSSIRLEKHPAVRIRYGDSMIEHRPEHGIKRKRRGKQSGSFGLPPLDSVLGTMLDHAVSVTDAA